MNVQIMEVCGFKVKEGVCPFCAAQVDPTSFKNAESLREYGISGICQECQDGFFE